MGPELLNKYIWLLQKIISAGDTGITREEISIEWEHKFDEGYPRKTFNNHKQAIEKIFNINIECNRSTNRYYINNGGDIIDSGNGKSWLIDTFTVGSMLSLAQERLSGRVSVEKIPSGKKYLTTILEAMQQNRTISFTYTKYGKDADTRVAEPYALKEDSLRWYMVGKDHRHDKLRVFSLDRISDMSILDKTFRIPEKFDVDELFAASFGIYLPDEGSLPIPIRFKAYGNEARYLRDLPIHRSQQETETSVESSEFSIFVTPNTSLYLEFLRHGPNIEVISPENVREKMAELTQQMASRYAGTDEDRQS